MACDSQRSIFYDVLGRRVEKPNKGIFFKVSGGKVEKYPFSFSNTLSGG
jgi:hypothetical protein